MPTEDQVQPHRDLRGLWLLPILALGLAVFVATWKKPPPRHLPTRFETAEQAKSDAYHHAIYFMIGRVGQGQPKGFSVIGLAPYRRDTIIKLGPDRFRCSGFLGVRSQSGQEQKEGWQCVVSGTRDNWVCESFQHTLPERMTPAGARPDLATTNTE